MKDRGPLQRSFSDEQEVANKENQRKLRFLKTEVCPTVGIQAFLAVDRAMLQVGLTPLSNFQGPSSAFAAKFLSKLRLIRNVHRSTIGPVLVNLMGFSESKTLPFSCWTEIIPYCFDCWPDLYPRWRSMFKRHRVRTAFFTARQSAQYFTDSLPGMKSVWLPEAADPIEYCHLKSWPQRDIDVLELGRKNDSFHAKIVGELAKTNRHHLFERVKGQIIFADRAGLIDGLGRSKLSICFPCSQTHPERSGSVETVTLRYFESIASKCLVVGHAPQELIDLFGYNPIIEVEAGREVKQIECLLSSKVPFQDLIEKNYQKLLEVGTWKARIATILEVLQAPKS
jgi:hypothetical protein